MEIDRGPIDMMRRYDVSGIAYEIHNLVLAGSNGPGDIAYDVCHHDNEWLGLCPVGSGESIIWVAVKHIIIMQIVQCNTEVL